MSQDFDFQNFLEKAKSHLAELTATHADRWGLGALDRWDADQETGTLTWSNSEGVAVRAPFQIVGTYNSLDNTFLWGWDHPSVVEPLRSDATAVLDFAKERGIDFLTSRKVKCSEAEAWEFAALATLICDRQGAYRGPSGTAFAFMTFGKVEVGN